MFGAPPDLYPCTITDLGAALDYFGLNGTSVASPQVAGLAALYAGMKGIGQGTP